jgi:hypothetical protein
LSESLTGVAKQEYEAGKVLYVDGDYGGALLKFSAAYDQAKDYRLLWNMVACEKNLRHYAKAVLLLDRYLAEGGAALSGKDRQDALSLRDVMTPFVGELTIEVNMPGAAVYVDGKQYGTSPLSQSIMLDQGLRKIRVSKDGYSEYTGDEEIRGGKQATLSVTLEKTSTVGTLVIHAGTQDEIRVDGEPVGTGSYTGSIEAGPHHVVVSADGKIPYESDVVVQVGQRSTVQVHLESVAQDKKGIGPWGWVGITGGILVAAGVAVAVPLALSSNNTEPAQPVQGTIQPGVIQLPLMR